MIQSNGWRIPYCADLHVCYSITVMSFKLNIAWKARWKTPDEHCPKLFSVTHFMIIWLLEDWFRYIRDIKQFYFLVTTRFLLKNWTVQRANQFYCLFRTKHWLVGYKAKGRISKWGFEENKVHQIFRKTNISYHLICTRTCGYHGVRNVHF